MWCRFYLPSCLLHKFSCLPRIAMSICLGIHCFSFVCFFSSFSFWVTGFCLRSQCKWLLWGNPPYSSCAWDKQHTFEQLCCIHTSFYYNSSLYFCCFSQCANLHLASVTGPVILENLCRFFKGDWHWRLFWGESVHFQKVWVCAVDVVINNAILLVRDRVALWALKCLPLSRCLVFSLNPQNLPVILHLPCFFPSIYGAPDSVCQIRIDSLISF